MVPAVIVEISVFLVYSQLWITYVNTESCFGTCSTVKKLNYSPFHKTIPESGLKLHCTSVRFYEMGVISWFSFFCLWKNTNKKSFSKISEREVGTSWFWCNSTPLPTTKRPFWIVLLAAIATKRLSHSSGEQRKLK